MGYAGLKAQRTHHRKVSAQKLRRALPKALGLRTAPALQWPPSMSTPNSPEGLSRQLFVYFMLGTAVFVVGALIAMRWAVATP